MRLLPRSRRASWLLGGAVLLAAGLAFWWWTREIDALSQAQSLVIFSIDGRDLGPDPPPPAGPTFHGLPILGTVTVTDSAGLQEIAAALRAGMAQPNVHGAACFWPRHAVRATNGEHTVDYLICFECQRLVIYDGGASRNRLIARSSQALLNKYLTSAGVPLAPGLAKDDP